MKKGFDNSIMAKNIKYLRCKLNITMTQLSEKLDLKSKSAILAYENGISEPSLKGLLILSDIFGVDIDSLIKKDLTDGSCGWQEIFDSRLSKIEALLRQKK